MRPVDYLPGARRDFDESFDWYAERSYTVAERFSNSVDDVLLTACLVKRFPFRIVYRVEPNKILVVAIAHAKRRPGFWRSRPN